MRCFVIVMCLLMVGSAFGYTTWDEAIDAGETAMAAAKWADAEAAFIEAVTLAATTSETAYANFRLGTLYQRQGKYPQAFTKLALVPADTSSSFWARIAEGTCHNAVGDPVAAKASYEQALAVAVTPDQKAAALVRIGGRDNLIAIVELEGVGLGIKRGAASGLSTELDLKTLVSTLKVTDWTGYFALAILYDHAGMGEKGCDMYTKASKLLAAQDVENVKLVLQARSKLACETNEALCGQYKVSP